MLSAKRKFNNERNADPECKRSKVSSSPSSVSVDENIPDSDNMPQEDGMACSQVKGGKLSNKVDNSKKVHGRTKKRLNLKKVGAGNPLRKAKLESHDVDENEEETESCTKQENTNDENIKLPGGKSAGCIAECSHDESEHDGESCLQSYPVCTRDISLLESDTERNHHINKCLDDKKSETSTKEFEFCQICKRDISKYNLVQQQQHLNRCCDNIDESSKEEQIKCPICGKVFKTSKTRQKHLKRCAIKNNINTTDLVQLNRNAHDFTNINNSSSSALVSNLEKVKPEVDNADVFAKSLAKTKRTKKPKLYAKKNVDEELQVAIALSVSIQPSENEKHVEKRLKKKGKDTELPALLLRSDNETKEVTAARTAAVLCNWADGDEEIQCTPALAPSTLVQKYGKVQLSETPSTVLPASKPLDDELLPGSAREHDKKSDYNDSDRTKSREEENVNKNEVVNSEKVKAAGTNDTQLKHLTVDSRARLWHAASLCSDDVRERTFYVPNLLPKSTPIKKRLEQKPGLKITNEHVDHVVSELSNPNPDFVPEKTASLCDITAQQQGSDMKLLTMLTDGKDPDDQDDDDGLNVTWFPSSGFCVAKDSQGQKENAAVQVERLVKDLSSMVGNPSQSDIKIVANNEETFFAHSFMLAARFDVFAQIISERKHVGIGDETKADVITLEMSDIDIRAVHAVMTFIYTASFIPVGQRVMEDVVTLIKRFGIDCDVDEWRVLNESANKNKELNGEEEDVDVDEPREDSDLDVLLKLLWEGEEVPTGNISEAETAFGDSILDEELQQMEIKLYTQVTPGKMDSPSAQQAVTKDSSSKQQQEFARSSEDELHLYLDNSDVKKGWCCAAGTEASPHDSNNECSPVLLSPTSSPTLSQSDLWESSKDIKDETIASDTSSWLVPATPRKISDTKHRRRQTNERDSKLQTDVSKPEKSTTRARTYNEQSTKRSCDEHDVGEQSTERQRSSSEDKVFSDSRESGSKQPLSPGENNFDDQFSSRTKLPFSPEEIIISPTFPRRSFFTPTKCSSLLETEGSAEASKDTVMKQKSKVVSSQNRGAESCSETRGRSMASPEYGGDNYDFYDGHQHIDYDYQDIGCDMNDNDQDIGNDDHQHNECNARDDNCENKDVTDIDHRDIDCHDLDIDCYDDGGFNCYDEGMDDNDHQNDESEDVDDGDQDIDSNTNDGDCERNDVGDGNQDIDCDDLDIDCYDDGGFNCYIEDTDDYDHQNDGPEDVDDQDIDSNTNDGDCESNDVGDRNQDIDCDDLDIDCYDDGGFNCYIEDQFAEYYDSDVQNTAADKVVKTQQLITRVDVVKKSEHKIRKQNKKDAATQPREKSSKPTSSQQDTEENVVQKIERKVRKQKKREAPKQPCGKSSKQTISDKLKKPRNPITPISDYSNLATPELTSRVKQFGMRPLPKRKMVIKLKEIYHYEHAEQEASSESEPEASEASVKTKKCETEQGPRAQDYDKVVVEDSDESSGTIASDYDQEVSDESDVQLSQASSLELSKQFIKFLNKHQELHVKILKYEPISLATVQESLKDFGIKCSTEKLKDFFDEQCITYTEDRGATRKRRRRKPKSQRTK